MKANGVVYQDKNDTDESTKPPRQRALYSLLQKDGRYYLKKGYSLSNLNSYTDLFVGWDTNESAKDGDKTNKDSRTYIAGLPKSGTCNSAISTCELKGLLVFIAKKQTMDSTLSEIQRFGVSSGNIMRLDGGPSAQFKSSNHYYHEIWWDARNLPHMIEILDKWLSTWFESVKILKNLAFARFFLYFYHSNYFFELFIDNFVVG